MLGPQGPLVLASFFFPTPHNGGKKSPPSARFCYHQNMKPYIRYGKNGFRLYPPRSLRGEAATAFLRFSAEYFKALASRYGEEAHLEVDGHQLVADLSQAPLTLRAARRLEAQKRTL